MRAVHLLHIMYLSNEGRSTGLPHSEFYNNDMSQSADLAQEYMIWRHLLVSSLPGISVAVQPIVWDSILHSALQAMQHQAYVCCITPRIWPAHLS